MPIDLLPPSKLRQAIEENVDDLTPEQLSEQLAAWKTAYPRLTAFAASQRLRPRRLMRVRRVVEYLGDANAVTAQLRRSMKEGRHEMKHLSGGRDVVPMVITISRLGDVEMVDVFEAADAKPALATDVE